MIFLGDFHGEWGKVERLIRSYDLENDTIICVGDMGVNLRGDWGEEQLYLVNLGAWLKSRNLRFLGIRGNHDDPSKFPYKAHTHLEFLADYTTRGIEGQKVLFVGGAISIDRKLRKEGYDYFPDEAIQPFGDADFGVFGKIDIVVTHDAPTFTGYDSSRLWDDPDNPVKTDAMAGRKILDSLWEKVRPKKWFFGHYHGSKFESIEGTDFRMLGVLEVRGA